ncbi:10622_t:CDS:2 [Paraglomus brasilianum]|uniref:FAD synthase n=1 Tax=Paraglomus brasilianum TaxID=144538 RepID=A0A9N9D6Z8_9GLOM|nr:10622_t:CDS:2 [Paraglomus brasilianum]
MAFINHLNEVYELAQEDSELGRILRRALKIIEDGLERYGSKGLSLAFNGGKDCTVLLHLYTAVLLRNTSYSSSSSSLLTVYITQPNPFPEVEEFVESTVKRYGLDLIAIEGPMKQALGAYLEKRPSVKAVLIGTRRNDPHGEHLKDNIPTDPGWPPFMRIYPIIDWNYTHIWDFLRRLKVPYCKLYDLGYTSLGSIDNTHPNPDLLNPNQPCGFDPAWKLIDQTRERCGRY